MNKWWIMLKAAWMGRKWLKNRKIVHKETFTPLGQDEIDKHFKNSEPSPNWDALNWAYHRGFQLKSMVDDRLCFSGEAYFQTKYSPDLVGFPILFYIWCDENAPKKWMAMTWVSDWGNHPELKDSFLNDQEFFSWGFSNCKMGSEIKDNPTDALAELFGMMQEKIDLLPQIEETRKNKEKISQEFNKLVSGFKGSR